MNFRFFLINIFFIASLLNSQVIYRDTINQYAIKLSRSGNVYNLSIYSKNKTIFQKTYSYPKLFFYNLDDNEFDELILLDRRVLLNNQTNNLDTLNKLYVFTFWPKFEFCDSLELGRYYPEFIQYDPEKNFFVKIYDSRIEQEFPSKISDLPFIIYELQENILIPNNSDSMDDYEMEIEFLTDELKDLLRIFDCNDFEMRNDVQRLIATICCNAYYSGITGNFDDFVKTNYKCDDQLDFLTRLKKLIE